MLETSALFRLLGDDIRLRMLRLVSCERVNVTELTAILGIAQSGVSRHLGLLRDAGLVRETREGGFTYYSASPDREGGAPGLWSLVSARLQAEDPAARELFEGDDARLRQVKRQRREQRDTHGAGTNGATRQLVPGRSWAAWSRALGLLLPPLRVVDLGCGDGHLTVEMAAWAEMVTGIDRATRVLAHARALARRRGVTNIRWQRGTIDRIPLPDGEMDLAVLSQALHHAEDPGRAVREATRVVAPGGTVLVLDLDQHDQRWVTERLGDRWLGFERSGLERMMRDAGLGDVRVETGLEDGPFGVLIAAGVKGPAAARPRVTRRRR